MARPATAARLSAHAAHRRHRATIGLTASALSVLLTFTVALLGPSIVEPALPGASGQPPWSLAVHPSPYLVIALAAAAVAAAAAGLTLTMQAARIGWRFPPAALLLAGIGVAVLLAFIPPIGSADHLSYAAYGRISSLGHDPYTFTPAALARLGDPVARSVHQFRSTPSVYGALATAAQILAAKIGGTSVRLTVFVLSVINVAAFAATGLLLHWLARGDRSRQLRAALLWTANPLLLLVLVAGQHVDSQAIVFVVAALAAFSFCSLRGALLTRTVVPAAAAGALVGLGFAIKISMVLAGAGLATACLLVWRLRSQADSERRRTLAALGGLAAGFALAAGVSLAFWGVGSLSPSLKAGSMTSFGSPWRAIRAALGLGLGSAVAEDAIKVAAVGLAVVLLALLLWPIATARGGTGRGPLLRPGGSHSWSWDGDLGIVCVAAFAIAWLFAWPYVLPWYDALGWPLVALLAWSELDWLLLARTTALAFGYLAGTGAALPSGLHWLQSVVREGITPAVLLVCLILLLRAVLPARASAAMRS